MQDKLSTVIEKHCETIKASVDSLGAMLEDLARHAADPQERLGQAKALSHQLKGSSGTAGFMEIGAAATALDAHLGQLRGGALPDSAAGIAQAMTLYQELYRIASSTTPCCSWLYGVDLSKLAPNPRPAAS